MLPRPALAVVLPTLLVSLVLPVLAHASSNPIPGVGIVVKRNPGSSTALVIPGGFFGAGSLPFTGVVGLEGRCSHDCGGCDNDCSATPGNPDGRLDYAADAATGPFDVSMASTTLYSDAPVAVGVGGGVSSFHVFVTLSGPGALPDDPIPGTLSLLAGQSLDLGTASHVLASSCDLHASITFADATTGIPAGSSIEEDLHLTLQDAALPIARFADGTLAGRIVLGSDGATAAPFTYASAGGELVLRMLSLDPTSPVPVRRSTWGAMKAAYR